MSPPLANLRRSVGRGDGSGLSDDTVTGNRSSMRMESGWGLSAQRESPNPRGSGSAVHGVVAAAEADVVSTPCSPGLGSVGSSADQADVAGDDGAGAARGGAAAGRWNSSPSPSGSLGDLSLSSTEWETPSHSFRGPDAESESSHGYSKVKLPASVTP